MDVSTLDLYGNRIYLHTLVFILAMAGKFSNKAPLLWVKNTKLTSFMDAYHAPSLLLACVILFLTSAINISGEPSGNLLAVLLFTGCILLLHSYLGMSIKVVAKCA